MGHIHIVLSSSRLLILTVLSGFGLGVGMRLWVVAAGARRVGGADLGALVAAGVGTVGASTTVRPVGEGGVSAGAGESNLPESVEGVLAAEGFEQAERLGRFLPTAQTADLERLCRGLREQRLPLEEMVGDAIFLRWMTIDPAGGLAFAGKEGFGMSAWWAWGKTDPEASLAAALKQKESWAGTAVLRAIAQSDPERARELIEKHPQFRDGHAMGGLAAGLMRMDPAAGATLVGAWNHSINHENHVSTWASRDPEAALTWAQGLPDQTRRTEALEVLVTQWAATNPEKIAPVIAALPEGRTKWKLYAEHTARLAATDPAAAREWVEAAPTARVRQEALVHLARGLAPTDPTAALATLGTLSWGQRGDSLHAQSIYRPGGSESEGGGPAGQALVRIASVAPESAMTFVTQLPLDAPVTDLTPQVFDVWMQKDSIAASEWLAGQTTGEMKNSATMALVRNLIHGAEPDYDAAWRWAMTLPKAHEQAGLARDVLRRWGMRDAQAARAALDDPAVSAELRAVMTKQLAKP